MELDSEHYEGRFPFDLGRICHRIGLLNFNRREQ